MSNVARSLSILGQRKFGTLFIVQFGGALNDNVLRNAVVAMITFGVLSSQSEQSRGLLIQLTLGLFMLPFFLFSASAGKFADNCPDRATAVRYIKFIEIVSMMVAAVGLALGDIGLLLVAVFLAGMQSAFFGPFKYALLPEILLRDELVNGNSLLNASTYIAILLGIYWGTDLGSAHDNSLAVTVVVVVIALIGFGVALNLPALPNPRQTDWRKAWRWRIFRDIVANLRGALKVPALVPLIVLISWFWMSGAIIVAQLPLLVRDAAGFDHVTYLFLLLVVCCGIALGSLLNIPFLRGKLSLRYAPAGLIVASLGTMLPVWPRQDANVAVHELGGLTEFWSASFAAPIVGMLLLTAVAMGFYIVPMYAALQLAAPSAQRGRMIATNNIINALMIVCGVVVAGFIISLGSAVGGAIYQVFALLGFCGLGVAAWSRQVFRRLQIS